MIIRFLFLLFAGMLAISLPTSAWFMSLSQFLLAGVFVAQGIRKSEYRAFYSNNHPVLVVLGFIPWHGYLTIKSIRHQLKNLEQPTLVGAFLLFYLVHLLGALYSANTHETLAALRIRLPALLLPLFFATIKGVTPQQKNRLLLVFVAATFVVTLISFLLFITNRYTDIREISPFIHHIQFSIQVVFSIIILVYALHHKLWKLPGEKVILPVVALWMGLYLLLILKSLTGVGVLLAALFFLLFRKDAFGLPIPNWLQRTTLIVLPLLLAGYLGYAVHRFYDARHPQPATLTALTPHGNPYAHRHDDPMLENANYVFYFIAEEELREAWNQRSHLDFDSLDERGQFLKNTLIRYMTSLGLRKDAHSLLQLTDEQIRHVEQGIANHLFTRRLSLYPRVYQTIWEVDRYVFAGNPSDHSFTQRLESLRTGFSIAADNLLFGVGTGDIKDHYYALYDQKGVLHFDHQRIVGANQLLNFVVGFGITGFLIIAFALLYPLLRTRAFANPLFTAFFIICLVAMLGEDMLKFQAGITFFTFFYCYFVFLKPDDQKSITIAPQSLEKEKP